MWPYVIRLITFERASSIQYGYRKSGTHERVFSRTLAHRNSKIERRQKESGEEGKKRIVKVGRSTVATKKCNVGLIAKVTLTLPVTSVTHDSPSSTSALVSISTPSIVFTVPYDP